MKTLFYPEFERLEIAEQAEPRPGPGEVLVRVQACGICGSELEAFRRRSPRRVPPLIMGHEFCGVIEELGPGVSGFTRTERVVSHSLFGCGHCARCQQGREHLCAERQLFGMHRPGAYAEYVTVPTRCVVAWPEHLPAEIASLAEPLANGVHVVNLTRQVEPQQVIVIGAGPIGLMCQQAFQAILSVEVTVGDLIPERLEVATKLGAKHVINAREEDLLNVVLDLTGGEGADVVVDAVGSRISKQQSLKATRAGGVTVWIGLHEDPITLDSYEITLAERRLQGSYAASMAELKTAVGLLANGQVDGKSWIKTFPLIEGVEAFHRMLAAQGDDIKAVLLP